MLGRSDATSQHQQQKIANVPTTVQPQVVIVWIRVWYWVCFYFKSATVLCINPHRRDGSARPLNKLTSELIRTYKSINEVVFCKLMYELECFVVASYFNKFKELLQSQSSAPPACYWWCVICNGYNHWTASTPTAYPSSYNRFKRIYE